MDEQSRLRRYEEAFAGHDPPFAFVDLDAMWKRLGVVTQGRRVIFEPRAPLAAIRERWLSAR